MLYLIYASKEAAIERADEEGKELGFDYWIEDNGHRHTLAYLPRRNH